jgi:hypothetical protein
MMLLESVEVVVVMTRTPQLSEMRAELYRVPAAGGIGSAPALQIGRI